MFLTTFFIISLTFENGTARNITNYEYNITENVLDKCLLQIIPYYTTSVTFVISKRLNMDDDFPKYLKIPNILADINYSTMFKLLSTNVYVVYVQKNSTSELRDILKKLITMSNLWDLSSGPRTKMVVIYLEDCRNIVEEIYKVLWDYDIFDAYVIAKVELFYEVYYTTPFANNSVCGKNAVPILMGTCGDKFVVDFVNFDLKNCKFVSGILNIMFEMPYIGDVNSKKPGLFINALQLISERYHIKMEYFNIAEKLQFEFFETSLQINKVIVDKSVDAVVCLHLRELE